MKSATWIFLPLTIILVATVILYPNFATRELELAVKKEFSTLPEEKKKEILSKFEEHWNKEYKQSGWELSPAPGDAIHEFSRYKDKEDSKFLVKGRFITSAKINQISQENPELILEAKNKLRPTFVEEWITKGRPLTIKLGLDLQGGMRVALKGDFEDYAFKLRESYIKEIETLQKTVADPSADEKEKKKAEDRLSEIESYFELSPSRKLLELEKAKLIIDNRLTSQNLTEPQVRIQKDQDSIEVSLPGVTNSSQILEVIQNTETVEYRLEEPENSAGNGLTYAAMIQQEENRLLELKRREETDIVQYQNIVKQKLGRAEQDKFLQALEDKYKIPKDKYRVFAYWARGNNQNSPLLPRRFIVLEKAIALDGRDMRDARPSFENNSFGYIVSFTLTSSGAEKFFEITSQNKGRNLAIVWGDKVVSAPTIRGAIAGGVAQIDGSFAKEEAVDLANVISEGALPIPLRVLEMRFIGPTLGIESIEVGMKAVLIGFVLVMFYMILIYRLSGLVANIALFANILILSALLSLMGFTLTLPGFAGIILTVGMAVDANVIIYERIKEELWAGKSAAVAVAQGFDNAFWTIIDSNVTTLISGILMIRLGNGPIKGFAITLCWGIVTSLFTSLFFSRLVMDLLVNKLGVQRLRLGFKKLEY